MNSYNVVTNYKINQLIKNSSKYYKLNLGFSSTIDTNTENREYNKSDEFAYYYNTLYKANILGQGSIGNIMFYTDHYIFEDKIAFYYKKEEFVFDFDHKIFKEKGVDFFLGHILKRIETEYSDRLNKDQEDQNIKKKVGDADKVLKNPGAATYEDLMAYMEKQRIERLKVK